MMDKETIGFKTALGTEVFVEGYKLFRKWWDRDKPYWYVSLKDDQGKLVAAVEAPYREGLDHPSVNDIEAAALLLRWI